MAAPYLTFQAVTPPSAEVNLTALTGGVLGNKTLKGFTGADWNLWPGFGLSKTEGGNQFLEADVTGTSILNGNYAGFPFGAHWDLGDRSTDENSIETKTFGTNYRFGAVGGKITYSNILAGQHGGVMYWYGMPYEGSWNFKVSLGDGSAPDVSLALPQANSYKGFKCTYRAVHACNLTLEITVQSLTGGVANLCPWFMYTEPWTKPTRPRG